MATTWNQSDSTGLSFSADGLTATSTNATGAWAGCRAYPYFLSTSKVYAEFTATNVGVSDVTTYINVMSGNAFLNGAPGSDTNSIGYNQNGSTIYNGSAQATLATWTTGNTVCIAVDGVNGKLWARVNNGNWNNDGTATANPATNSGGISCPGLFTNGPLFFGTSIDTNGYAVTAKFAAPFTYAVPSGFAAQPAVLIASPTGAQAFAAVGALTPNPRLAATGVASSAKPGAVLASTAAIAALGANGRSGSFALTNTNPLIGIAASASAYFLIPQFILSLLNYEGFDHESSQADLVQGIFRSISNASLSLSTSTAFNNGACLDVRVSGTATSAQAGYAVYNIGAGIVQTCAVGVMTHSNLSGAVGTDVGFTSNGSAQVFCRLSGGNIFVYRGAPSSPTLLQALYNVIPAAGWFYFEMKAKIAPSGGTITLQLNGTQIAALTGLNTSADGTSKTDGVLLGGRSPANVTSDFNFDDLYVAQSFLGPLRIYTLNPTGNGAQVQFFTTSTLPNSQSVSDIYMDGDNSYNYTKIPQLVDEFTISSLPSSATAIVALKVTMAGRKDSVSNISLRTLVLSNSSTQYGVAWPLTNTYQYFSDLYLNDPSTGVAWTASGVSNAQIGYGTMNELS